jgi:hypothetical protein
MIEMMAAKPPFLKMIDSGGVQCPSELSPDEAAA